MALCAQKCFIYLSRVICYTVSTELYIVFELSDTDVAFELEHVFHASNPKNNLDNLCILLVF